MATYNSSSDGNQLVASPGTYTYNYTGTEAGAKLDGTNHAAFSFASIPLAQNQGIVSATLKFQQLFNYTGGSAKLDNYVLYGHNNSSTFLYDTSAGSNYSIAVRLRTHASVEGSTLNATATQWQTTGVDVTRIAQEIISRPGWASGDVISILFIGNGSAGNFIQPYMLDYSAGYYKATLEIVTATSNTSYPSANSIDTSSGTGNWTNPSNVYADDSTSASADISLGGQISYILKTSGYSLSIPGNANINGITVTMKRNGSSARDTVAQLFTGTGNKGFNHPRPQSYVAATETVTFGAPDDLWGYNWTPAEINAASFGFAYQVANNLGGSTATVDSIKITVYYNNANKGYYTIKQSYLTNPDNPTLTYGNPIYQDNVNVIQAITNTASTYDLTRMTWRGLGVYFNNYDPKLGTGGIWDRTGTPFKIRVYSTLADARNGTSPLRIHNGIVKSTVNDSYDSYFTPLTWTNSATLYFVLQATGVAGSGEPNFFSLIGTNYGSTDDDTSQAVSMNSADGDTTDVAVTRSLFYEAYSAQGVVPGESAFPVGDSIMTASGYNVSYGLATIVGDSDMTASGYQVGFGSASIVGDAKMIADRIVMLGNSIMTANGTVNPQQITKTYMYKIYDKNFSYLGVWNDVVSEFGYSQEINSAGSAITVTLARNSDSLTASYDSIADDSLAPITTDDGGEIAAEIFTLNAIGPGTTVDLNLNVKVYEFSSISQDIAGDLVFTGYISKYVSQYGSQEQTAVSIFSYGADLDNWVLTSGNNTRVPYLSYDPSEMLRDSLNRFQTAGGLITYGGGTPGVNTTTINFITNPNFEVNTTGWTIGTSGTGQSITRITTDSYVGTASLQINSGTSNNGAAVAVAGLIIGQVYTMQAHMKATAASSFYVNHYGLSGIGSTFTTATGGWDLITRTFTATATSGNIGMGRNEVSSTCYIDAVMLTKDATALSYFDGSTTGNATNIYSWTGPANDSTSTWVVDIDPVGTSIDDTNTVTTYTFNINTELEVIKKTLEIAPTDWYFYTDLATNMLHFHARPIAPNHYFYLGKHILNLNLEKTIEGLVNDVYFTGGKPANIALDRFNGVVGTDLTAHVGEVGATWTRPYGATGVGYMLTDANRLRGNAAGDNICIVSGSTTSSDYTIQVDYNVKTIAGDISVIGRADPSVQTFYMARIMPAANGTIELYKCVAGTYTLLQSQVLPTAYILAIGQTRHLTFKMEGAQLTVYIDGTAYCDIEDRSIITGTRSGVRSAAAVTDTTGFHLDNFQVQLIDNSTAVTIFRRYIDSTSIGLYRRGLVRLSDSRVTLAASADTIVTSQMNRSNTPRYRSSISISNGAYPIRDIKIGQLVGFRNFGNYVDTVTMQVVRIDYKPDEVTLGLDTLLPSVPKRLEDIKRNLAQSDVVDNPDAPTP